MTTGGSAQTMTTGAAQNAAPVSLTALLRDRGGLTVGVVLLVLAAASWMVVVVQSTGMQGMVGMEGMTGVMLPTAFGTPTDVALFTLMWGVMMAAMMLPSAIPMIALYALVSRGKRAVPTWVFAGVYLVVWLALGVPVYLGSVAVAALAADGAAWPPYALAAVLAAAGAYQFTAVKRVCLKNCQTPLSFIMERWHASYGATLRLALSHAAYCVGCCWGLMVILVTAGAMSLPWVLLVAAVVFAEKLLPRGEWVARGVGSALILLAVAIGVHPDLAVALRGTPMPMPMPADTPGRNPAPGMGSMKM